MLVFFISIKKFFKVKDRSKNRMQWRSDIFSKCILEALISLREGSNGVQNKSYLTK